MLGEALAPNKLPLQRKPGHCQRRTPCHPPKRKIQQRELAMRWPANRSDDTGVNSNKATKEFGSSAWSSSCKFQKGRGGVGTMRSPFGKLTLIYHFRYIAGQ